MKVKCLFGHKFGEWQKVDEYLERRCLRCGKQEVIFPSLQSILARALVESVAELIELHITKKKTLPKS